MDKEKGRQHFVLVHGACHGAWCWYKVSTLLASAGHRVTALDMAASGINSMPLGEIRSFSDYCEPLLQFLADLPPDSDDRVVLVGHSSGGFPISTAMEIFPHKISVVVFVAAFMPGPDHDHFTISRPARRSDEIFMDSKLEWHGDPLDKPRKSVLFGPELLRSKLYQLSPPEDLTLATLLMRPVILGETLEQTKLTKEKYGCVRRVYVVLEEDKMLTPDFQKWSIKMNPVDEVMAISGADHMAMFSKPRELSSALIDIAHKYH